MSDEKEYRTRPHDHLVEPLFAGLGKGAGDRIDASMARGNVWLRAGLSLLTYAVAVLLGYELRPDAESVAAFRPASGVLLGALLVTHRRAWLLVVPAAVLLTPVAAIVAGESGATGLIDAGVTFEALLGAYLIRRFGGPRFGAVATRQTFKLVAFGVVLGPAVATFLGALVAVRFGSAVWSTWPSWWFADALGVLAVTPLFLAWEAKTVLGGEARPAETALALATLLAVCAATLGGAAASHGFLAFIALAPLLWIAARLPARTVAIATLATGLGAVCLADAGRGPFLLDEGGALQPNVPAVRAFLATLFLAALFLNAAVRDRRLLARS